jgi:hypothetical protein
MDSIKLDSIKLKAVENCRWDCVSLGEVMQRLDPGEERIHTTRHFRAWEGGGEYNMSRGLRRCFGMCTAALRGKDFSRSAAPVGVAHGALAMTTPGDTSMATRAEVEAEMRGSSARISR